MRALVATVAFTVVLSTPGLALAQGAMTNGANHAGSISVPAEIDTWTFTADQGDAIVLSIGEIVRVPDSNFWPWIRVTGPMGATLVCGNCWGPLATQMAATAPLTGHVHRAGGVGTRRRQRGRRLRAATGEVARELRGARR